MYTEGQPIWVVRSEEEARRTGVPRWFGYFVRYTQDGKVVLKFGGHQGCFFPEHCFESKPEYWPCAIGDKYR